ncbi:hypothetical protein [Phyllobacterium sp. P5_D12]
MLDNREFEYIDKLALKCEGTAFDEAVETLTDAEREQYLTFDESQSRIRSRILGAFTSCDDLTTYLFRCHKQIEFDRLERFKKDRADKWRLEEQVPTDDQWTPEERRATSRPLNEVIRASLDTGVDENGYTDLLTERPEPWLSIWRRMTPRSRRRRAKAGCISTNWCP